MIREYLNNGNLILQVEPKDIINDIFSNNMLVLNDKYGLTLQNISIGREKKGYFSDRIRNGYYCITQQQLLDLKECKILELPLITTTEWAELIWKLGFVNQ